MSKLSVSAARPSWFAVCAAGLLALAVAMGIGRFAFTPMLPLMIRAGSADVAAGGWLAAANYAGYLVGALTAARLPWSPQRTGLLSLALIVLSTAGMGYFDALAPWLLLRAAAGVASAWTLVGTSVWCLAWLARLGRPGGAGLVYAGVGVGIAVAGLYCWRAGIAGVAPDALWLQLGLLAGAGLVGVAVLMPRSDAGALAAAGPAATAAMSASSATSAKSATTGHAEARSPRDLVLCYGLLGFGYILPATFLPVLARAVIDDPAVFGAAWPVFGGAAALSTVFAGAALARLSRRQVLAGSHLLMALGCLLPVLHLSATSVLASALLVGGTFMVATMAGMQEARALAQGDPARALGHMTAAFALGQMAGPLLSSALSGSAAGFGGLFAALSVGALALVASGGWLLRRPGARASS